MRNIITACYWTFVAILARDARLILISYVDNARRGRRNRSALSLAGVTPSVYTGVRRVNHGEIAGASAIVCCRRTDVRGRTWLACRYNSNKTATSRSSCSGRRVVTCALADSQEKGRRAWPHPPCSCRTFWRRFSPPRSATGSTSCSFASWKRAVGDEERIRDTPLLRSSSLVRRSSATKRVLL